MSDEEKKDGEVTPEPKQDDPLSALSPETKKLFEETQSNLLSALEKERDANKEAKKRLAALEKAAQDAEKKRLKESEDYRALYETAESELAQYKPKAEKLDEYETILKETLARAIEEIPEDRRQLVPTELPIEAQLRYISANRQALVKAAPFDMGAGKRGGTESKTVELSQEEREVAQSYGMTAEEYAKFKD